MNPAMGDAVLSVSNASKCLGGTMVLSKISLKLHPGEIVTVIGSSGAGKSTLLRCIDLLDNFDSGEVNYPNGMRLLIRPDGKCTVEDTVTNKKVPFRLAASQIRRSLGFVSQGYDLWDERTVLGNLVLAPIIVGGRDRESAEATAAEFCRRFGLMDKLGVRAWQLSGGQRQRVAIIRALMMYPDLLLLDEVTSSLDPILTYEIMELVRELKSEGRTMLLVTHHLSFACGISDRIVFLEAGRIVQDCKPEVLLKCPATPEVTRYLNILQSSI